MINCSSIAGDEATEIEELEIRGIDRIVNVEATNTCDRQALQLNGREGIDKNIAVNGEGC